MNLSLRDTMYKVGNSQTVWAVRNGLIMLIPIIMVGCGALIIQTIPVEGYQEALANLFGGRISALLSLIQTSTVGMLSLYMTVSISMSISETKGASDVYGGVFTSLANFMVFSGIMVTSPEKLVEAFGTNGMFNAVLASVLATNFYLALKNTKLGKIKLLADGVETYLNNAFLGILLFFIVTLTLTGANMIITGLTGTNSFYELIFDGSYRLFENAGANFLGCVMYLTVLHIFWFFGMHGSNMLASVSNGVLQDAMMENVDMVALGLQPENIFNKGFIDAFVLMGGCGSSICLLVALLLFGSRRNNKRLAFFSALPVFFNVNEMLVFGLPIILNPTLLIPFIFVPLINMTIAYTATLLGILPIVCNHVGWTTPVIFSGYMATGSMAGSLIQVICIIIGVLVYMPFIRLYEQEKSMVDEKSYKELVENFRYKELMNETISLVDLKGRNAGIAKAFAESLRIAIEKDRVDVAYQRQHDSQGNCIGAEALLRWKHPMAGVIYPPFVIKLAQETGLMVALDKCIFKRIKDDMDKLAQAYHKDFKVSVNLSPRELQNPNVESFLEEYSQLSRSSQENISYCIEVTEEAALHYNEILEKMFIKLHEYGYSIAIDDFSMGSTSLKYIQNNKVDIVKLDGSLIRQMKTNERTEYIVESIVKLAEKLEFTVIAEYVEDEETRDKLQAMGCTTYQGYLYGAAEDIDQLIEKLTDNQ